MTHSTLLSEATETLSSLQASLSALRNALHSRSQALHHAIPVKLSHDLLHSQVERARNETQKDQDQVLKLRTDLASLRYERSLLELEISQLRQKPTASLSQLELEAPKDDCIKQHEEMNRRLNSELAQRKEMRQQVDQMAEATEAKRAELSDLRKQLATLPQTAAKLTEAVKPVEQLVGGGFEVSEEEAREIRSLCAPLYVLAREACMYRSIRGGLKIEVMGNKVGMWVEEGVQKLGGVFRFEGGVVMVEGEHLEELFPYDTGLELPVVGGGKVPEGGKAYVWANVICGVPCLPRLKEDGFGGWPWEAMKETGSVRFAEVVKRLRERMEGVREVTEVMLGLEMGMGGVERFRKAGDGVWKGGVGGVKCRVEVGREGGGKWRVYEGGVEKELIEVERRVNEVDGLRRQVEVLIEQVGRIGKKEEGGVPPTIANLLC